MMRIIKRTEAHYEIKDAEFGKVYRWRPERVVIECVCGQKPTLTGFVTACDGCATDHTAVFWEEVFGQPPGGDEVG